MFNQVQANEQPFVQAGQNALPILQAGIGAADGTGIGPLNAAYPAMQPFTLAQFQNSPGYQFQQQEGQNAILNNRSALGGVNSGNTLKALTQFGQQNANQDYWNAYNAYVNNYLQGYNQYTANQNQRFGQFQTLTGSGQNAAANLGSLSSGVAANIGNNLIGAGNAISAGQVAQGQAASNAISGIGQNALLYSLLNNQAPSAGATDPYAASAYPYSVTPYQIQAPTFDTSGG